jgi:outer membrane protein OmpA-like peptidoglycan-associated protein
MARTLVLEEENLRLGNEISVLQEKIQAQALPTADPILPGSGEMAAISKPPASGDASPVEANKGTVEDSALRRIFDQVTHIQRVHSRIDQRGAVFAIEDSELFSASSSQFLPQAPELLQPLAKWFRSWSKNIKIEGWVATTGRDLEDNTLAQARAESVAHFLYGQGIPLDQLRALGYGGVAAKNNKSDAGAAPHSGRIEIILER